MSGNFYDNPVEVTYNFPAAVVSAAATIGSFRGPQGKAGRVRALSYAVTTEVTVAASLVSVGASGAAVSVAAGAVGTAGTASITNLKSAVELPVDTAVAVTSDGGSTAGAADISVTIGWF